MKDPQNTSAEASEQKAGDTGTRARPVWLAGPRLRTAMARVEDVIGRYYPEALDSVKAGLAVATISCLRDQSHPMALIFVAAPGAGKSTQLGFLMPTGNDDALNQYFYRSDEFTPRSFVSHRADRNEEKLKAIDLLPQLKDKVLVTKELAPIFKGKRDELVERFAMLTTVLDGDGLVTNSGAHGRRGYTGRYIFQWLGAVARPSLTAELLEIIAELGPRMLFFDSDRPLKATADLVALVRGGTGEEGRAACRAAVRDFVLLLYKALPLRSLTSSDVTFDDAQLEQLALWAQVLARLRAQISTPGTLTSDGVETPAIAPEHCERILWLLRSFAIGSALAHGRREVNAYDLAQIAHIALSSGVPGRARVLRAVLANGGRATTPEVSAAGGGTHPTALRYMRELAAVGIVKFTKSDDPTEPASVSLAATVDADFTRLAGAPIPSPDAESEAGEGEGSC